jgi:O-antigen ligase
VTTIDVEAQRASARVRRSPAACIRPPWGSGAFGGIAAITSTVLSIALAMVVTGSQYRSVGLAVFVAGAGAVFAALALSRMQLFVLAVLAVRTVVDIGKLADVGTSATDPSSLLSLMFLGASITWIVANRHLPRTQSRLRTAILVFLAANAISIVASSNLPLSVFEFSRIASVAMMFLVIDRLIEIDPTFSRRVVATVALSSVAPIAVTIATVLQGGQLAKSKGGFDRLTGTFEQANSFSRYLMFVLILGIACFVHVGPRVRIAIAIMLVAGVAMLLLTYTRSSWLALVLGLIVVAWQQHRRAIFAALAVGIVLASVVPSIGDRVSDLDDERDVQGSAPNSFVWRMEYWADIIPLANESPVIGLGPRITQERTEFAKQPHNDFVRAYVESGVVGLFAYLFVLWNLVTTSRAALRVRTRGLDRGVVVAFAGCVLALIVVSLVANVISQVVVLWYFFAIAAVANQIVVRARTAPE